MLACVFGALRSQHPEVVLAAVEMVSALLRLRNEPVEFSAEQALKRLVLGAPMRAAVVGQPSGLGSIRMRRGRGRGWPLWRTKGCTGSSTTDSSFGTSGTIGSSHTCRSDSITLPGMW